MGLSYLDSDQLLTLLRVSVFLMPVLFQDHAKSNHSVRRDLARKETGGAGKKDAGKTAKKTGMSFLGFLLFIVLISVI